MVAVTGATGHLGTPLVQSLLARGEEVVYLVRPGSRSPGLERNGSGSVLPIRREVDLFDVEAVTAAILGADVVFHSAAFVSFMPGHEEELYRVNVGATGVLLEAARRAGVRRFVYVGSVEAFPLEYGPYPITDDHPIDPERTVMAYGRSKAIATRLVLDASSDDLECIVCCPTALFGPPDYRRSPFGSFVLDSARGRLPASVDGGFDFADVRDVADGIVSAANRGRPGCLYLLSGHYVTVSELLDMLVAVTRVSAPGLELPIGLVLPFAPLVELYYRVSGRPPRFTRHSLKLLSLGVRFDPSRAARELGYSSRPLGETVADTVEWFSREGML